MNAMKTLSKDNAILCEKKKRKEEKRRKRREKKQLFIENMFKVSHP